MHPGQLDAVSLRRAIPVAVSCGLHGLVVALTLAITFLTPASEPRVLFAELVPLDAPRPAEPPQRLEAPEPPKPAPVIPPRLLRKPVPSPPTVSEPPPPPAAPPTTAPSPVTPSPVPRVESPPRDESLLPVPSAASDSAAPSGGDAVVSQPDAGALAGNAVAPPGSREGSEGRERAVARVAPGAVDGVTQVARPQGGYQVRPSYPTTARRLGAQGTTVLRVFVADDGRVTEIVVQESAGHADLDRAASDAVARWRFEPARRGAQPVGMWVLLPVQFQLR